MINDLYIIADQSRLVAKNIINQFKETGCNIKVLPPVSSVVFRLPNAPVPIVILLSDDLDFNIVRQIAGYQRQSGYLLCFIGRFSKLSLDDDNFYKRIPSIKLESFNLDPFRILELMEKNNNERKHILVVDDEPIILRSIKIWLQDDFELSLLNSGELALEFLDMHPVDLVLLDYKMPMMDGPSVLAAIRNDERLRKLPVIFLTSQSDRQSVITAMQYKPDGYILKTKTPEEIKQSVIDFFKNRVIKV